MGWEGGDRVKFFSVRAMAGYCVARVTCNGLEGETQRNPQAMVLCSSNLEILTFQVF